MNYFLHDIGALERQNPLPIGIYSVDLRNDQVPEFRRWQQGRSSVKVLKTNDNGSFSWILFSVSAPTLWATGLGFPSTAKATDERPQAFEPEKDPVDKIADAVRDGMDRVLGIVRDPIGAAIPSLPFLLLAGVGVALYLNRKVLFENATRKIRDYRSTRRRGSES